MTPAEATNWARSVGLELRYGADLARLAAAETPFVRLDVDTAAAEYIARSRAARHGLFKTWLHRCLRSLFSDFDVNGLLGTYPMHVLSTQQWRALLSPLMDPDPSAHAAPDRRWGRLLDIGAGRGDATSQLARLFDHTTVTETSAPMARRLRKLGFECIEEDVAASTRWTHDFDAVSLLNVLDRCDNPMSLLGAARSALRPGGVLVVALVLPYSPFVYDHGKPRAPRQRLPIVSQSFEVAAAEFVTMSLVPLGLRMVSLSRAPYLSGGDARAPLYELDDLIAVCQAQDAIPIVGSDL